MQIQDYLTTAYLLNSVPPQESRLYIPLIILFSLLVLSAVGILFIKNDFRSIANKFFYAFLISGILGFIYLFCRYEGLPVFGARLFLIVIILILLIWMIYNIIWMAKHLPFYIKQRDTEERYSKYLPRKKSKNIQ
jgi:predicted PurR-regulated permease PerM